MKRHLLDFGGWERADLESLLDTARVMSEVLDRPVKKVPALQGFTVCTAFFENSTRTRLSFELAARRMSADVVSFTAGTSSLSKGESLRDTLLTLEALRVDLFVIRHSAGGAPRRATTWTKAAVVNAGDGRRAHPTQALLDAYTLRERFGKVEGLEVAIVGDIRHSRVARSNAELLTRLGAKVRLCGPATLLPESLAAEGVTVTTNLNEALEGADAVMALRLQQERMATGLLPSLPEYQATYQVTAARLERANPAAVLLHPGPMNRDVEVEGTLADSERSLVLRQVENGLPVRMAVLYHLLVGRQ
ncbi:MAG TPA: aspartate carbamoyltransferase catalytic subunit [Deinococcales bacterium]|nr:aspartate carbamoyltransferase catalytic subunit [Deinococcales bacterium]